MAVATLPDLARLLVLPVFAWAAYRDVRTRRVRDELWYPLYALGVLLLLVDFLRTPDYARLAFLVRVAVSLALVPLGFAFWYFGTFGGADFKALAAMGVLLPTFPYYYLGDTVLPLVTTPLGVFSLSALTNAMLLTLAYPGLLAVENAARGRFSRWMVVGREVAVDRLPRLHGSLLEDADGFTRAGLDIDALRMYLRWRGVTLDGLRADPSLRDPATLPADPNDPTDGAVLPDGGEPLDEAAERDSGAPTYDDPWGARAFLDDIEGSAYGTDPETLRRALDLLVERDTVWVTPGLPFVVPLFVGLLAAFTAGDLLTLLLNAIAGG
ncbi:prepilin peptidase [Halocalculus aciditolerans]|uniref:Peptidase A24 n=1 Tax=Halocalculus aciditolerans TaxID=1383812 RepID=A0A830FHL1_9EURY|nr:prepilin peptidase [Halocalculus aciditolerans]GGL48139.1 peptidase A24 [Halocalculus aciditolerans]